MDFTADPCTDFYQYSCGALIDTIQLPPGVDMYIPVFNEVEYDNYVTLNDIVNDQWPLINDLYVSCMANSDDLSADTINSLAQMISTVQTLGSTDAATVLPVLASLHRMGVSAYFQPTQQENIFQSNSLINLLIYEATLPVDLTSPTTLQAVAKTILQDVNDITSNYSLARATNVANMEAAINALYVEPNDYVDLLVNMTWSDFLSLTGVDYGLYATEIGVVLNNSDTVIVATPEYVSGLSNFYGSNISLQTLTDYLVWRIIYSFKYQYPIFGSDSLVESEMSKQLRKSFKRPSLSFVDSEILRPHLSYATGFSDQQLSCIDNVDSLLGDFMGLIFTLKVIDDTVIDNIHTVTGGIQNSFRNNLAGLTWIDANSKAQAAYKLSNILQIIGHPNKLDRYRGLLLDPIHFLDNIVAIQQRVFDYNMQSVGTPYNRSQNEFPATIVNAFYNPEANTINFPAGILESPMFSTSFPMLMQYARMGYVIGHETTHGFDNSGRLWNAFGVYQPIMDDNSSDAFNERAQCIVNQYNQFQPVPGYFVNGEQTLGENIADLGGVKNAFYAYQAWVKANGTANLQLNVKSPLVPQLTNQQAFFVVMAQTWCTKATTAGIVSQLQNDVHSPSQFRVNGPLSNLPAFSEAYSCPLGSAMNPTKKCELW
jgi:predicted metalloendopeptidase